MLEARLKLQEVRISFLLKGYLMFCSKQALDIRHLFGGVFSCGFDNFLFFYFTPCLTSWMNPLHVLSKHSYNIVPSGCGLATMVQYMSPPGCGVLSLMSMISVCVSSRARLGIQGCLSWHKAGLNQQCRQLIGGLMTSSMYLFSLAGKQLV